MLGIHHIQYHWWTEVWTTSNYRHPLPDIQDVQGVELYYNAAITPRFHLTADLQIVDNENVADDSGSQTSPADPGPRDLRNPAPRSGTCA
jgi:hypothetical protein